MIPIKINAKTGTTWIWQATEAFSLECIFTDIDKSKNWRYRAVYSVYSAVPQAPLSILIHKERLKFFYDEIPGGLL